MGLLIARKGILTPHHPPLLCPPAAWSCPRPGPVPCTRRPSWFPPHLKREQETWPAAFSAASRFSTAHGRPPVPVAIHSARRGVLQDSIPEEPVHAPSILRAQRLGAMPGPLDPARRATGQALQHGLALARPAQVASAARPVPAAHRRPARRRAQRAPPPGAVAGARSIQRPRKAR